MGVNLIKARINAMAWNQRFNKVSWNRRCDQQFENQADLLFSPDL